MTDTYDYGSGEQPHPIDEWRNDAPAALQPIADESAAILKSYEQHRDLADQSKAAGDAFVTGVSKITDNFSAMVKDDPASYDVARALARNAVGVLVGSVPGMDPEAMVGHAASIYGDVERQLARSAVTTLADRDEIAARAMLARVGGVLPEDEHAEFNGYIDVMAKARSIDGAAMRVRDAQETERVEDTAALGYLSMLSDARNGEVLFRPGWAQSVIADKRLPPDATAALVDTQARLIRDGDEPMSDPALLRRVLDGVASGEMNLADVMQYAGAGLKLSDALGAAQYSVGTATPQQRVELDSFRDAVDAAHNTLANPAYGPAGVSAFGRFVEWAMPMFRSNPGAFNPAAEDYALKSGATMMRFRPSFDNIVTGRRG